jgi:hypothetical protein
MARVGERAFEGSRIPDPGFAGDSGQASDDVVAALEAYAADRARKPEAVGALQRSRLLVPVVAVADEVELDEHGRAVDKSSDMAAVLLRGADGRMALLAFTGLASMARWDPAARPVPVSARDAARAAVQEQAAALVVDVAGPVPLVVEGEDLTGVAAGWTLARVGERTAWFVLEDADDHGDADR